MDADFVQVALSALRNSDLYAGAKKFHAGVIISVITDEGYKKGEVHSATRIYDGGKKINLEYSEKWLRSYCSKVLDLIQNEKIRTQKNG